MSLIYFQADYSVYVTVVVLCGAFGTSIVYPLLSLKLCVDDCILGEYNLTTTTTKHLYVANENIIESI